jgi:hypothetical protein
LRLLTPRRCRRVAGWKRREGVPCNCSKCPQVPMYVVVAGQAVDSRTPPPREVVSPELALIDPVLAREARSWLPEPGGRNGFVDLPAAPASTPVQRQESVPRLPGIRPRPILVAAVVSIALLLFVDFRPDRGRPVASGGVVETPTVPLTPAPVPAQSPTKAKPKAKPQAGPRPKQESPSRSQPKSRPKAPAAPTGPVARRFAWAPVTGASAYHIEIFKGRKRVFASDTRRPEVTVPRRWRLDGVERTLQAGSYRWYVWPVIAGERALKAVVQAQLVVD